MSIYDGDFSKINAAAVVEGSKVQAQNVLQAALNRITALEAENKALRTVTPEMIAAGWEVARKGRPGGKVFIGPGPCFKEIYQAMSARALLAKGDGE